jgi:hypothetical protein
MFLEPVPLPKLRTDRPENEGSTGEPHRPGLKCYCQPGIGQPDTVWWRGRVLEISTGGLGLLLGRRFEPGTSLTLDVESLAPVFSTTVPVRVMQATPQPRGGWLLACVFVRAPGPEERQALLLDKVQLPAAPKEV